jgi:MATE family multidrug resistance protein
LAIVFMVSLGLSSATAVLTAEASGRRALREATHASLAGLSVNTALMLLAGAAVFFFSGLIGRAYTANLSLAGLVSSLLWLVALVMPPDGAQVVAASALRARGDNWFPTASHLLAYALVMPALAVWLAEANQRGVEGLLLAIFLSSLLSSIVLCARLWWLRNAERASS